ncbi:hypothetical protein CEJ86_28800 [Sinorhizobium meliloti]|uniref:Uncharacterized protein n=1 Tax=Rhizobium meliloti TaxID=382 RepID=A0A2J0YUP2_RHIML|nr:hypothetical protein CEJ86_28800 [Sinorhizobium meliloti]
MAVPEPGMSMGVEWNVALSVTAQGSSAFLHEVVAGRLPEMFTFWAKRIAGRATHEGRRLRWP